MKSSNKQQQKELLKYKSDDTDELMEGLFTNKRSTNNDSKPQKPKSEVDNIVQEAYEQAMEDVPRDNAAVSKIVEN